MQLSFIDSHAHVYLPEFDRDRPEMLGRAEEKGVGLIIMPAIDSSTHEAMLRVEAGSNGRCRSMMGLHPCSVKLNYREELGVVSDFFGKRSFSAVGEVGLDHYWDTTFLKEQQIAFREQIELALHYDVPVVIHSREAVDDCIAIIEEHQRGMLKGVFHCFSGNESQAKRITGLGLYLGIGGVITFRNAGLDRVMHHISLEHVVLETDAPYLAPVPFRGKRNECSYLRYVAEKLASIKSVSVDDVARITTTNAEKLFGL
ncbi:MAG TPA: TatD family hydrolase [Chitinophagaceae bacterium]|nr:TatD family hydrolase [Chitinophagaceae bacterium]